MKTLTVGEFKSKFSEVIDIIRKGGEIAVSFGKRKEKIAVLVPVSVPVSVPYDKYKSRRSNKRKLGILESKASFHLKDDFKMTDKDLLSL